MPTVNFENDKYIPSPLPEICAPRQNLLKRFNHTADNRLTAVCAPAGYGKTVSALLWIRASHRRSVWIGLDKYDNAPFVFYKLFCTGLLSVQPHNAGMAKILSSRAFQSAPVEQTVKLLMKFAQSGQSYALILDDLHTISNKQILKSLSYILKQMPPSFHILLLSRYALPGELEELAADGSNVIAAKELAFSMQEIRSYYGALGYSITKAQAQSVFEATGGWAIGINALSHNENFDQIQGSGQLLENYINKNIWEKWDPELRDFMLVTSIADEIDAELCRILTDKKDAKTVLDKLLTKNSFIVKISENSYRYHHLFLEFLRDKRKERTDIDVPGLSLKVADFYFKQQEFFKALAYYVHTENSDGINKCFFQLNSGYLDFSVEAWLGYFSVLVFDKLPETFIRNNIALVIEAAWANYLGGNAEATLRYIDIVYDHIASENNLNAMIKNDLLGFVCTIRFADFRKGLYEYTEDFAAWVNSLPDQNQGDINIYTPSFTQNFPYMHRSFSDCLEIVLDMDNRLQAIKEVFGTIFYNEVNLFCYCASAGLYYELNKLEKAHEIIILAQRELKKGLRFEMHFCVFMLLSQILNAIGKTKESESVREHFTKRIQTENALYLNPNFLAVDTKYKLWNANQASAKMWLEQLFVTNDEPFQFYRLYQYFTTARAYIVLSEQYKAAEYLDKLKKLSAAYRRPLDLAETGVLLAALQWSTGSKPEATQTLEEVLLAMQPYHAIRIIAEEGAAVLPILKKICLKVDKAAYEGPLDGRYLKQVLLCSYEVSKTRKGITANLCQKAAKLSKQQKYVLSLLAQGYKNSQIVEITGLTLNTIRTHTKIAYQKLGVSNVADAVIEAKRLNVIES